MIRSRSLVPLAVLALTLVACGKSTTVKNASSGSTTSTTAAGASVSMATNAKLGSILVDAQGRTLYHNTKESATTIVCVGSCADMWPPVIAPSTGATLGATVPGSLGTVARPDGTTQVTYNGEPLYLFANDHAPGDVNGQGVGGVWFAVTPAASGPAATLQGPTTTAAPRPAASPATTTPRTTVAPAAPVTTAATAPPATAPPTTRPPTTMAPPTTYCAYPPC